MSVGRMRAMVWSPPVGAERELWAIVVLLHCSLGEAVALLRRCMRGQECWAGGEQARLVGLSRGCFRGSAGAGSTYLWIR